MSTLKPLDCTMEEGEAYQQCFPSPLHTPHTISQLPIYSFMMGNRHPVSSQQTNNNDPEASRVYSWIDCTLPIAQIPEHTVTSSCLRLVARRSIHEASWNIFNAISYINYVIERKPRRGLLLEEAITMKQPARCVLLAAYNLRVSLLNDCNNNNDKNSNHDDSNIPNNTTSSNSTSLRNSHMESNIMVDSEEGKAVCLDLLSPLTDSTTTFRSNIHSLNTYNNVCDRDRRQDDLESDVESMQGSSHLSHLNPFSKYQINTSLHHVLHLSLHSRINSIFPYDDQYDKNHHRDTNNIDSINNINSIKNTNHTSTSKNQHRHLSTSPTVSSSSSSLSQSFILSSSKKDILSNPIPTTSSNYHTTNTTNASDPQSKLQLEQYIKIWKKHRIKKQNVLYGILLACTFMLEILQSYKHLPQKTKTLLFTPHNSPNNSSTKKFSQFSHASKNDRTPKLNNMSSKTSNKVVGLRCYKYITHLCRDNVDNIYKWLFCHHNIHHNIPVLTKQVLTRTLFIKIAYMFHILNNFHPASSHTMMSLLLGTQEVVATKAQYTGTGYDQFITSDPAIRMYFETRMGSSCFCTTSKDSNHSAVIASRPKTSKTYYPHKPRLSHPLVSREKWRLPPKYNTMHSNPNLEQTFIQRLESSFKERIQQKPMNRDNALSALCSWIDKYNRGNKYIPYHASEKIFRVYGSDQRNDLHSHIPWYIIQEYLSLGFQDMEKTLSLHKTSILRTVLAWNAMFDQLLPASLTQISPANNGLECGSNLGGKYTFIKKLGSGAFANVWLAQDDRTDELVAIKFTKSKPANLAHTFIEIRHLRTILSLWPYSPIVGLRETMLYQDQIALVMNSHQCTLLDFHTSTSFSSLCPKLIGVVAAPILVALHTLAQTPCFQADGSLSNYKGVVHCDLKPENILVRNGNFLRYYGDKMSEQQLQGENAQFNEGLLNMLDLDFAIALSMVPNHRAYLSDMNKVHCPLCGRDRNGRKVFDITTNEEVMSNPNERIAPDFMPFLMGGDHTKPLAPCEFVALAPVRLADMGSACAANEKVQTTVQTLLYRAPEVLAGTGYGPSADMWSLGCVLAELFLGETLFPSNCIHEHAQFIEQRLGCMPSHLVKNSVRKCDYEKYTNEEVMDNVLAAHSDNVMHVFDFPGVGNGVGVEPVPALREAREKLGLLGSPQSICQTFMRHNYEDPFSICRLKYTPAGPGLTIGELFMSFVDIDNPIHIMQYDLIVKMLTLDPEKRITPLQALQHPFFATLRMRLPVMHSTISHQGEALARHFCLQQRAYNSAMHTRLESNPKYRDLVQYTCDEEIETTNDREQAYSARTRVYLQSKNSICELPFDYHRLTKPLFGVMQGYKPPLHRPLKQPDYQHTSSHAANRASMHTGNPPTLPHYTQLYHTHHTNRHSYHNNHGNHSQRPHDRQSCSLSHSPYIRDDTPNMTGSKHVRTSSVTFSPQSSYSANTNYTALQQPQSNNIHTNMTNTYIPNSHPSNHHDLANHMIRANSVVSHTSSFEDLFNSTLPPYVCAMSPSNSYVPKRPATNQQIVEYDQLVPNLDIPIFNNANNNTNNSISNHTTNNLPLRMPHLSYRNPRNQPTLKIPNTNSSPATFYYSDEFFIQSPALMQANSGMSNTSNNGMSHNNGITNNIGYTTTLHVQSHNNQNQNIHQYNSLLASIPQNNTATTNAYYASHRGNSSMSSNGYVSMNRSSVDSRCSVGDESVMSIVPGREELVVPNPFQLTPIGTNMPVTSRLPLLNTNLRTSGLTHDVSRFTLASQPNSPSMMRAEFHANPAKLLRRGESVRSSVDGSSVCYNQQAQARHFSFEDDKYVPDSLIAVPRFSDYSNHHLDSRNSGHSTEQNPQQLCGNNNNYQEEGYPFQ